MQIICKILFQYRLSGQFSFLYLYTGYRVLHDTYILGTEYSTIPIYWVQRLYDTYIIATEYSTILIYWVQGTPRYLYTRYRVFHDTYVLGTG